MRKISLTRRLVRVARLALFAASVVAMGLSFFSVDEWTNGLRLGSQAALLTTILIGLPFEIIDSRRRKRCLMESSRSMTSLQRARPV